MARPRRAVLFELENLAVDGHGLVYDAVKSVFKGKGIDLPPALFSRCCLGRAPQSYVPAILKHAGKERLSHEKLEEDLRVTIQEAFAADSLRLNPSLAALLQAVAAQGVGCGALSGLENSLAEKLFARLGLKALGVALHVGAADRRGFPTAEAWGKLSQGLAVDPVYCLALCTTAQSTRAALAAHMHAIAIPHALSAFEDYSGADEVLDSLQALRPEQLLARLEPGW